MFSSRKTFTATALYCLKASASTVRSTAASGSQVYESHRAVNEYLLAHFGASEDQMPYQFGPQDGTQFPLRLANLCVKHRDGLPKKRALDIGCAVGAASFHLTADFDEVVGIDFSQHFIDAANEMKSKRQMPYTILKQGDIFESRIAKMPEKTYPQKATFYQGDACNLSKEKIGTFDVILAANLLCRLPAPVKFLRSVPDLFSPGGTLMLVSPYSWLEEYTEKKEWIGARSAELESFKALSEFMAKECPTLKMVHRENIPFVIREHERKFQYGVSDCVVFVKSS